MRPSADRPVLIIAGPPGSGKTTTASLLASSSERAVHIESDCFFRFIRTGYIEPWKPESHEQNTVVMDIVAQASVSYADAGYFTVVEGIIGPGWFFEPLRDSLRRFGHQVAYAVLRPPLDVCVSRAADRQHGRLSDPTVVERLWHGFRELGPLEHHAIDTGVRGADEIARLLGERLVDGRLAA